MVDCTKCGASNYPGEKSCRSCSAALPEADVFSQLAAKYRSENELKLGDEPIAEQRSDGQVRLLTKIVGPLLSVSVVGVIVSAIWRRSLEPPSSLDYSALEKYTRGLESASDLFDASISAFCILSACSIYLLARWGRSP